MKEIQSNINIIGGGLIGAVTAYSLSKLGNKVVILEQNAKFNHKKILDKRTTAISEGTKRFLENINKTIPKKNLITKFLNEPYLNI